MAPDISNSTVEERREYIKRTYPCIANCDMCGLCQVFHGKDAETAYDDYITGKRSFMDVSTDYRRWFGNKIIIPFYSYHWQYYLYFIKTSLPEVNAKNPIYHDFTKVTAKNVVAFFSWQERNNSI